MFWAADQTNADANAKKAIMDADAANVRQLEAMQSFKQIVAPFDAVVTARNTDIGAAAPMPKCTSSFPPTLTSCACRQPR